MQPMRRLVAPLAAALVLFGGLRTVSAQQVDSGDIKQPEMTPSLDLGKLDYERYCASCHGVNAAGTAKGPTFLHRVYHPGHHADGAFLLAARRGARRHHWNFGDMKPVEGVTDRQIESIVGYVRALQKVNGVF